MTECEEKLKEHYHINPSDSLYMFVINIEQVGMTVGSFEYELLYPLNGTNLVKLDLSVCKDVKVKINIPFNLTDDLEKYNSSSSYYNDVCYIADSEDGTDLTLSERQNGYVDNNMQVCEEGCDFDSYNTETQKAVCSCGIKLEVSSVDDVKVDKDLLLSSFTDLNNFANIKLLICYKTVFQKKLIMKNIGFFLLAILILLNLICLFLFLIKYWKKLINIIKKIKSNIPEKIRDKNILNKKTKIPLHRVKFRNKNKSHYVKSSERKIKTIEKENIYDRNHKIKKLKLKRVNNHSPPPKTKKIMKLKENRKSESFDKKNVKSNKKIIKANSKNKLNLNSLNKKHLIKNQLNLKGNKVILLIYSEMNDLSFEEAVINDNRTFTLYYFSLIKINHPIFSIFNKIDYNSLPIKLSIFFFNIGTDVAVNSLFFSDSTMHKIHTDRGSYNFIYQIPQIVYSTIISSVIGWLIALLGLTENNILKFKKMNTKKNSVYNEYNKLITILKIKIVLFYFFVFAFLFLFWYYLTCFCGIYRNTQIHLIKDSLISFVISLIKPIFVYLLPAFFRIKGLKNKSKYMYKASQFLEIF